MKRTLLIVVALVVVSAGCSSASDDPTLVGIRASIDPAVGDGRFLFAVNQIDGTRRGAPDEVVTVTATALDAPGTVLTDTADFLWILEPDIGLYRADLPWDSPGTWEVDFSISTGEETEPFLVLVQDQPATVAPGEPAPLVRTPTLDDTPIEDLSTDSPPNEDFYRLSLDEALANGQKTVVIFATPAFCTSAACGPMIQQAKEVAAGTSDVNWVHVEVYEGFNEDGFAPDADHLAPAVKAFGLPSEPWIFVMDESGVVVARFEGVLGPGELEDALGP